MRKGHETIHLTANDLVGHLNCRYLTALDLSVARGEIAKPSVWDPVLEVLAERGAQHEKAYIDHLKGQGDEIIPIDGIGVEMDAVDKTVAAMKAGAPIVVQAALQDGRWSGRADVLRRVEKPSVFGAWSYEVVDTKLVANAPWRRVTRHPPRRSTISSPRSIVWSSSRTRHRSHVCLPEKNRRSAARTVADHRLISRVMSRSIM